MTTANSSPPPDRSSFLTLLVAPEGRNMTESEGHRRLSAQLARRFLEWGYAAVPFLSALADAGRNAGLNRPLPHPILWADALGFRAPWVFVLQLPGWDRVDGPGRAAAYAARRRGGQVFYLEFHLGDWLLTAYDDDRTGYIAYPPLERPTLTELFPLWAAAARSEAEEEDRPPATRRTSRSETADYNLQEAPSP